MATVAPEGNEEANLLRNFFSFSKKDIKTKLDGSVEATLLHKSLFTTAPSLSQELGDARVC